MCGTFTSPRRRTTLPGRMPRPAVSPSSEWSRNICMPMQIPSSGLAAPAHSRTKASRPPRRRLAMPAAKLPTPGSTTMSLAARASRSPETKLSAPTFSRALATLARLPIR